MTVNFPRVFTPCVPIVSSEGVGVGLGESRPGPEGGRFLGIPTGLSQGVRGAAGSFQVPPPPHGLPCRRLPPRDSPSGRPAGQEIKEPPPPAAPRAEGAKLNPLRLSPPAGQSPAGSPFAEGSSFFAASPAALMIAASAALRLARTGPRSSLL
jgi:hypothetical protein